MTNKDVLIEVNKPSQLLQAMRDIHARNPNAYDVAARRWRMPVTDDAFHDADSVIKEGGK